MKQINKRGQKGEVDKKRREIRFGRGKDRVKRCER